MTGSKMLRVAFKGLKGNPVRTILMMLGIIIGIAALAVIMAVGEGTRADLEERTGRMFAQAPLTVMPQRPGAGFTRGSETGAGAGITTLTVDDAEAIAAQIANVAVVAPTRRKSGATVVFRDRNTQTQVFGVVPEWFRLRDYDMAEGEFITEDDVASAARVCLLGPTVVRQLFGDDPVLDETIRVDGTPFRVKGVLAPKGASPMGGDFDNRVVVPLSTFDRRLYGVTHLSQIVTGLHDPDKMRQTREEITALMRERHGIRQPGQEDFTVRMADVVVDVAGQASRTLTIFLGIVAGISLVVGGVVVMNIMLISVSERTQEIGLRRAVGASGRDIMAQFRAEALLVTGAAGLCGVVLGIAVSYAIPLFTDIRTAFSWQALVVAVVFSVIIGLIFGTQPARRAADMDPVAALRSE